jgi:hypothetical protein
MSWGKVRYELKTPYRDGTTHVIFEPLDFIAKLAALVPRPRVNLTRYHNTITWAFSNPRTAKTVYGPQILIAARVGAPLTDHD